MLETDEVRFEDFLINGEGVFYIDNHDDHDEVIEVCSPLVVTATTRNTEGNDWGKQFSLIDPEGSEKHYHMRSATLAARPQTVIADLVHRGLMLSGNTRARNLLIQYLRSVKAKRTMLSSSKPGWVNGSFVLPHSFFGHDEVIYSGGYQDHGFGTAGDWKKKIGKFCSGNSRLLFAASTAFAAPLLGVVEMEGGGFHFRGSSSVGKSTALEVAASVCGSAGRYLVNWDTTKNSLEEVAEAHNDCLMVIDELGLVDPAIVGETLYMIANGHGKSRMGQTKRRWRVLFLTSGEISLAEHMAEAGKETKKGQEVRLLDIAADAGAGMGLFENLHSFGTPSAFANYLKAAARQHYGAPLNDFLRLLTGTKQTVALECHAAIDAFSKQVLPPNVSGEVPRAARRFGVVAAAGELATKYKLTSWKPGEATAAAERCFAAWIEHRRSFDPDAKAVDQVRLFILGNEEKFEIVGGKPVEEKCGYKKKSRYLILPDVFKAQVCAGMKPKNVAESLERAGYLNTSGKSRLEKQERIGGDLMYFYSVSENIREAA